LVNSRIELILTRSNTDLNSLISKNVNSVTVTGSIILNKVIWKIPHISVDGFERLKLLKIMEKEKSLFIPFRSYETYEYPELGKSRNIVWNLKTASKLEKPRYVVIAVAPKTYFSGVARNNFTHPPTHLFPNYIILYILLYFN
jgi:hypothetical protein